MMEVKSEGAQSYTIPLDSVDLTYLSKYVRTPHADKRPLWTRKCLDGESEYCHIQIVTQDDNEDCYSEETCDTFNCHICNVEVPVLCFKKHNESEKHVALKTIFQKVLERVSKQINMSVINIDKDIDEDVYYCVPCSKIIKIENKHKHELSQHHVKSQRDNNVVLEFCKIFEESKGYVDVKEEENKEILDDKRFGTESIQNDTKNNNVKDATNEDNNDETKSKTVCSTNDYTMKPTSSIEHLVQLVPNNKHNEGLNSKENYFKDMVKKYNLKVNLPIEDSELIYVTNTSGVTVKISQDHFHSYLSVDDGMGIYCQMCHIRVELREESKHKVSKKHARSVFIPVNEQFARTRNEYSSHCLVCNTLVMTSSLSKHHLCNEKHVKLLNSAKLTDICQNNEDLANRINTENKIERTHTEKHEICIHVNKSEENKIIECINNKEYICKLNLSENNLGESDHLTRTKDATSVQKLVVCKLCNVSVPQDQMKYHNAGTPHAANALKKNCTGVADGVQAYFSKDNLKTDSETSEILKDTPRNYKAAKQNNTPKNDNVPKQNNSSENDNVTNQNDTLKNKSVANQNDTLKNDNVGKQNDSSENDNVTNQNDTLKNESVANQNDTLKNDNAAKQNDSSENDNLTNQNTLSKNGNLTNQNDTLKNDVPVKCTENDVLKNDNVAKQNDSSENDNVTNQNDTLKNESVANQNDTLKNDNAAKQNDSSENDNLTNQNTLSKNDNVTNQNDTFKNDVPIKCTENDVLKNDNVAKQNHSSENDNVTNQNDTLKNESVANQNDTLKNDNAAKQNDSSENDNLTNQNDTLKNDVPIKCTEKDVPKNDNVAKQNDSSENNNVTNQNILSKNDNVTNQNDRLKNDVPIKCTEKDVPKLATFDSAFKQMCLDTLDHNEEYFFL